MTEFVHEEDVQWLNHACAPGDIPRDTMQARDRGCARLNADFGLWLDKPPHFTASLATDAIGVAFFPRQHTTKVRFLADASFLLQRAYDDDTRPLTTEEARYVLSIANSHPIDTERDGFISLCDLLDARATAATH
jgi:hypothetical protein